MVFLWVNSRSEEGGFPAVHVFLGITGQLDLTEILVHVPREDGAKPRVGGVGGSWRVTGNPRRCSRPGARTDGEAGCAAWLWAGDGQGKGRTAGARPAALGAPGAIPGERRDSGGAPSGGGLPLAAAPAGCPYLCSVLKMAKTCLLDMNPFSTSLIFRLSRGNMYFFSFSWKRGRGGGTGWGGVRASEPSGVSRMLIKAPRERPPTLRAAAGIRARHSQAFRLGTPSPDRNPRGLYLGEHNLRPPAPLLPGSLPSNSQRGRGTRTDREPLSVPLGLPGFPAFPRTRPAAPTEPLEKGNLVPELPALGTGWG